VKMSSATPRQKMADMPDDEFNAYFQAAMKSSNTGNFKMTNDEQQKIMEAMKKPEFGKLLREYMDEISDPKNREEQEQYLRQLERENQVPEGIQLAYPKPGFVVKAKRLESGKESGKLFINICSLEELEKPSAKRSAKGVQWNLPYSLGPLRHERDNRGEAHPTFDFALHPEVLQRCFRDDRFRKMVIDTATDAVDKRIAEVMKSDVKINRLTVRVLQNVACMGGKPAVMQIGRTGEALAKNTKAATSGAITSKPNADSKKENGVIGNNSTGKSANQKTKLGSSDVKTRSAPNTEGSNDIQGNTAATTTKKAGIEVLSETNVSEKEPVPPSNEPKYTITHRGKMELADFVSDERLRSQAALLNRRPKELVLRVQVSKLKSAKYLDIETSGNTFKLCTVVDAPAEYELHVDLPYPVDEESGAAKFDKSARILEVVLPVIPPSPEEIERLSRQQQEQQEKRYSSTYTTPAPPTAAQQLVEEVAPISSQAADSEVLKSEPSSTSLTDNASLNSGVEELHGSESPSQVQEQVDDLDVARGDPKEADQDGRKHNLGQDARVTSESLVTPSEMPATPTPTLNPTSSSSPAGDSQASLPSEPSQPAENTQALISATNDDEQRLAEIIAAAKAAAQKPLPRAEDFLPAQAHRAVAGAPVCREASIDGGEASETMGSSVEDVLSQELEAQGSRVKGPARNASCVESAEKGLFEAAAVFGGARPGFVFKLGQRGLGYYKDDVHDEKGAGIKGKLKEEKAAQSSSNQSEGVEQEDAAKQEDQGRASEKDKDLRCEDEASVRSSQGKAITSRLELRNKSIFELD